MAHEEHTTAIDLSHHISDSAKARRLSPFKGLMKYYGRPGMLNLAGGMPDPSYFPFASISGDALLPDSFPKSKLADSSVFARFWRLFGKGTAEKTQRFSLPRYAAKPGDIDLASTLQYSTATGHQQLQDFIRNFTAKVHRPAYSNWSTLVHIGNTDGINRAIDTLCNPGEFLLVEEWTYPATLANTTPKGIRPAPVKTDSEGMSAVDLERVMEGWDETARGAKRPHVMCTVPIGQNPTGATMGLERKKAIYRLCVKYDIIIIEDDPYFFLQEGTYVPKSERMKKTGTIPRIGKNVDEQTRFIESLVPSFFRIDTQGRVVRLDSFSKIIAPGSRLGWITANPIFIERFERQGETSTQAPCGFSQALVTQLITQHWGPDNFLRWLEGVRTEYTLRRDFFVDCLLDSFDVRPGIDFSGALEGEGGRVYTAYKKTKGVMCEKSTMPMFSFVPPSSGMFIWLKFHIKAAPILTPHSDLTTPPPTMEQTLWDDLVENGLILVAGSALAACPTPSDDVHFRVSFSIGTDDDLKRGVMILTKVLNKYV